MTGMNEGAAKTPTKDVPVIHGMPPKNCKVSNHMRAHRAQPEVT